VQLPRQTSLTRSIYRFAISAKDTSYITGAATLKELIHPTS
jgi:hypothetical protein